MSQCHHHIMANSSFSWFGVYLDDKLNSITVAPQKWFLDKNIDVSDLYLPSWKVL